MRKIIVSTLVTLDGVIEDPSGIGGSPNAGWASPYFNAEAAQRSLDHLSECDYFLCGRRTYEMFAKQWPNGSGPYADRMNSIPKLVASTTLSGELSWNATLLGTDAIASLKKIKEQPGRDIMMYGSSTLMSSLLRHGLVDRLDLLVFPIVVGAGQRMFTEDGPKVKLNLVSQDELSTGAAVLSYQPMGRIEG